MKNWLKDVAPSGVVYFNNAISVSDSLLNTPNGVPEGWTYEKISS